MVFPVVVDIAAAAAAGGPDDRSVALAQQTNAVRSLPPSGLVANIRYGRGGRDAGCCCKAVGARRGSREGSRPCSSFTPSIANCAAFSSTHGRRSNMGVAPPPPYTVLTAVRIVQGAQVSVVMVRCGVYDENRDLGSAYICSRHQEESARRMMCAILHSFAHTYQIFFSSFPKRISFGTVYLSVRRRQ